MCETCGCSLPTDNKKSLDIDADQNHAVIKKIMSSNDKTAEHNRHKLNKHGIFCINIMSSPGGGKTKLLEASIAELKKLYRIAVIEGDLETENDAERIRAQGVEAIQITTGSACHLDAHHVHQALHQLNLDTLDLIFIENVGNLVCPAAFDLGQHANIALLSVTEGDDKPLKYPVMFQKIHGLVISKIELLDYFDDFNMERALDNFRKLANQSPVWPLSAKTGRGMEAWLDWLVDQRTERKMLLNPQLETSE
ncbi:Hydrogenase nickel incorporation protein HypB [Alteromonadaceae bacterium Bs31]|nr:Hydrogenase nickel incorporation protein HypB [Alteromonadaceae bacterium Bs31]